MDFLHSISQRCGQEALPTSSQRTSGPKFDQDLVFGHGDLLNAFFLVDLL